MQLNELKQKTKRMITRRVGRGGKRGKTSGRGTKGQKARAGHRIRPEMRDVIKKLPKQRGYKFSPFRVKPIVVNVKDIETHFEAGDTVSPKTLLEKGMFTVRGNKEPKIKILGEGEITKKVSIEGVTVSKTAKEAIEKAGGSIA